MGSIDDSVDDVDKRSKIIFDRSLTLEEALALIKVIAVGLTADVVYSFTNHAGIYQGSQPSSDAENELRSVELGGSIRKSVNGYGQDTFQSLSDEENPVLIRGIRFFRIPGYRLEEYDPHTVKLWDEVREVIKGYFKPQAAGPITVEEELARR